MTSLPLPNNNGKRQVGVFVEYQVLLLRMNKSCVDQIFAVGLVVVSIQKA